MKGEDLKDFLGVHKAFWRGEDTGRPLFSYREEFEEDVPEMKLADGNSVADGIILKPEMLSAEALHPPPVGEDINAQQAPCTRGDLFLTVSPYGKIPWVEAIVGCPVRVRVDSNSIWAETCPNLQLQKIQGPSDLINDEWLKKLMDITRYLVANFHGPYLVTQTSPTRGPIDMLDALMGTERMILEMHTHPRRTMKILEVLAGVFIKVVEAQLDAIPTFQEGYCNPFGLWAPGSSIRAQDHASAVLSPRLYGEFVLPIEGIITSQFDYVTYHTHTGMLHLEDKIAEMGKVNAIHVSVDPEPYDLPLRDTLPKLARLQKRKPIIIDGEFTEGDVDEITKRLPPKGLCIISRPKL